MKTELLAVQAGCHQRQQDGAGAHQGLYPDVHFMGPGHDQLARIGDTGAASLRKQSDRAAIKTGIQKSQIITFGPILVDYMEDNLIKGPLIAGPFQETAGSTDILHDKDIQCVDQAKVVVWPD